MGLMHWSAASRRDTRVVARADEEGLRVDRRTADRGNAIESPRGVNGCARRACLRRVPVRKMLGQLIGARWAYVLITNLHFLRSLSAPVRIPSPNCSNESQTASRVRSTRSSSCCEPFAHVVFHALRGLCAFLSHDLLADIEGPKAVLETPSSLVVIAQDMVHCSRRDTVTGEEPPELVVGFMFGMHCCREGGVYGEAVDV